MPTIANLILVLMGLIPVIISMIKVEKYYTSFHTGLWNLYGTILIILGYISDFDVPSEIVVFGIFSICFIVVSIIISYQKNKPNLIRYIGKSSLTVTYTIFFTLLFFSQEFFFTIIISLFTVILTIILSKIFEMRNYERFIYRKYIKKNNLPPKFTIKKIIGFQREFNNLRIVLYVYPFLISIFSSIVLLKYSYNNKSLSISIIFLITLTFLPFYISYYKCKSLFSLKVINMFKNELRWFYSI